MRTRLAGTLAVLFTALLVMSGSAHAAVFDVNTTNDTPDADVSAPECADSAGDCSLRAAIDQANENPDDDTINVPDGRYVLTIEGRDENQNAEGDLDIGFHGPNSGDTDIVGESTADTIVDANGLDRVFHVFDGTDSEVSFDVDISDLTITGGAPQSGGGGILNDVWDTLTLERVRVTRNIAIAGGGILNSGHAVLLASTVDRNSTIGPGGGICSSGELNVEDSTVNDNTAGIFPIILGFGSGGGIAAGTTCEEQGPCFCEGSAVAGAVAHGVETRRELTVENSTIDGNDAFVGIGGGVAIEDVDASLLNVTVTDNLVGLEGAGGGLATSEEGTMEVENTIVADNRNADGGANCDGEGIVDLGHNLENLDSCGFTEATSRKETPALLERLSDNGGPTNTRALRDGSQAIDGADNDSCPADDQRGETRPPDATDAGPACDIGAYERIAPPEPPAPPAPLVQQQQQQQPQQQACTPAAPRSSISRNSMITRATTLKFTGRSTDLLCGETRLPGEVNRVQIAVAQVVSNTAGSRRCRFLTADGDLTRTRACDNEVFRSTRLGKVRNGKVPWGFRQRRLDLPAGRYQVVAVATDTDGIGESELRRFNLKRFTIR
jgi:CSLREA domain-containing protein